ncbi:hypothetical protein [Swaminathania salitolerans]|uniref:Uncharacterized protein n=1 Tax=Swaminathania salitolerans TaxID=182838 RepID=A0A511BSZ8_9PROT|nr:hypothetical protein [Swaminathania salitolerans]GBQ12972.1 hypothetical protein AA21291_1364 [Swaminathania salitolerans LMG 21291]GEL03232.1 hypothetical protein SSA02_23950 [Swaminathania salitolerans]
MKDTVRALRLYASPVGLRENPQAAYFLLLGPLLLLLGVLPHKARIGPAMAGSASDPMGISLWILTLCLFGALNTQLWRQLRTPVFALQPRIVGAEFRAFGVLATVSFLCLLAILVRHGLTVPNALALLLLGLLVSAGPDRVGPRSARAPIRPVSYAVLNALALSVLFPPVFRTITTLPTPIACAIAVLSLGLSLGDYLGFRKWLSPERHTRNASIRPFLPASTPRIFLRLSRFDLRLPALRRPALPMPYLVDTVPGATAALFLMIGAIVLLASLPALLDSPHWETLLRKKDSTVMAVLQALILAEFVGMRWTQTRRDWPYLLTLGRWGSKRDFSRAIIGTHGWRAGQGCAIASVPVFCTLHFVLRCPFPEAIIKAIAAGCLLFGTSFLPCLRFFSDLLDRPVVAGLTAATGILLFCVSGFAFLLFVPGLSFWIAAPALLGLGVAWLLARLAPRFMARRDWPLEPQK